MRKAGAGRRPGSARVVLGAAVCALLFTCVGARAKVEAGHGFLRQDPTFPHWFSFDDGTYPFLVGTTNYDLMGTPDQNMSDTIDWQAQYFNVMRVSLRPKRNLWKDYGRSPSFDINKANPFGGSWSSPTAGSNSEYWTRFNAMVERAASKGVMIELIVCRDGHKEYNPLKDSSTFGKFMSETSKHWNLIYSNHAEFQAGTDPNDPDSFPGGGGGSSGALLSCATTEESAAGATLVLLFVAIVAAGRIRALGPRPAAGAQYEKARARRWES